MQDITWTIVVSVVAGLITASTLLVLKSLFFNSFLPWYRQAVFKGIDLGGSWYSLNGSQKILLEISQVCENISGKATVRLLKEETSNEDLEIDEIRMFDVEGEISARFVDLRFRHIDTTRLGMVTFLLQVGGDGTKLEGQGCWYTPISSSIKSGPRTFYRDEIRAARSANTTNGSK